MLRINKEQVAIFKEREIQEFEERMVVHLGEIFPKERAAVGELGLREIIREGIERAGRYGIVIEFEVCLFLYLMLMLGRSFDEDPEHAWASAILEGSSEGPENRVERVFETVTARRAKYDEPNEI